MTFAESLSAARAGDREAIEQLLAAWRPLLRLQAARLLGSELSARVDPSDVVQESFTQAVAELPRFEGDEQGQWVAWLQCLVTGHAAKARRYHHAQKRSPSREVLMPEAMTMSRDRTPVRALIELEEGARLAELIEQLPDAMRLAVTYRVFFQCSWDEVAERLGKSTGAARVLWTRALKRLRDGTTNW